MEPADELRAASPRPELTVTQAGTYCRLVRFTITSDTTVTPDYPDNTCAGSNSGLLARRLVGQQMGWSAASGRTLTVPIRIENRTQYAVQLPIRIELPTNNKKVIIPFEHTNTAIVPLNMDSTLGNGTKVWLVGGSGMLGSGDTSVVHNLTFQVDTPVVKAELWFVLKGEEQDSFPAVAPSFRPAFFNADTSYNSTSILKRVLRVRFHDTATTNARATAVDSVAGEVIGGDGENFYYIFVPTATSTAQLDSARATLKRQPAVRAALPVLQPLFINGRRPNDGSGFNPDDWTFIPDSSSGSNWWLEDVALPLAWGCETGSADVQVSVIDNGFSTNNFGANLPDSAIPSATFTGRHGRNTASIVGSATDDNTGMPGVAWNVKLRAFDASLDTTRLDADRVVQQIINAMKDSVPVINVSVGGRLGVHDSTAAERARWKTYIEEGIADQGGVPSKVGARHSRWQ